VARRAENDKIGYEHVTPLSDVARTALESRQRVQRSIGEAFLFQSPKDPSCRLSRHLARDWMQRAQVQAKLPPESWRGWHSVRRHFASELRESPLRDICDLGGWKDPTTVVRCYQRPSEQAMRKAMENRKVLNG
jgi:integrase